MGKKEIKIVDELLPRGAGRDELRQLYSWSAADAAIAQAEFDKNREKSSEQDEYAADGPYARWLWAQMLKELYQQYKDGDPGAILEALDHCFHHDLPIPLWCTEAFKAGYNKTKRLYESRSWDAVFGTPHPGNTKIGAHENRVRLEFIVFQRVRQIKLDDPARPIDRLLFDEIGEEFGISGALAEKYYCGIKKHWGE